MAQFCQKRRKMLSLEAKKEMGFKIVETINLVAGMVLAAQLHPERRQEVLDASAQLTVSLVDLLAEIAEKGFIKQELTKWGKTNGV